MRAYHGIVNRWLLVVYAVLGVWGVYYLVRYWGGLGPGWRDDRRPAAPGARAPEPR